MDLRNASLPGGGTPDSRASKNDMRFFFVAGTPSRAVEAAGGLVHALVAEAGGPHFACAAETPADIGEAAYRNSAGAVLISRVPSAALRRIVIDAASPFLIFLSIPIISVTDLMADHGESPEAATRAVANSLGALSQLVGAPNALIIDVSAETPPAALAASITNHLGLDLDKRAVEKVLDGWADAWPKPTDGRARQDLGPEVATLVEGATGAHWAACVDGSGAEGKGPLHWSPRLFLGGAANIDPGALIDLTGPIRCLFYGPYVRLREGMWAFTMTFEVDARAAGLKFLVEVFNGAASSRAHFEVTRAGVFDFDFSFNVEDEDAPIDIRVFNEKAAFEGVFILKGVTATPVSGAKLYPSAG